MKKGISLMLAVLLVLSLSVAVYAAEDLGSVQAMLEELPTVEAFRAMDADAQLEVYNQTQAAYDAYMALPEEERIQIEGAEEQFETLFSHFNTLIAPAEETQPEAAEKNMASELLTTALAVLIALAVLPMLVKRKRGL